MNCNQIQRQLMSWAMASTTDIVVPNYYLGRFECDVMKISGSGMIYEYEIKISKQDFKKDFEKGSVYATGLFEEGFHNGTKYQIAKTHIKTKHSIILSGQRCNRFYFVVPEGLVKPEEVPAGLGLVYASDYKGYNKEKLTFRIVKISKLFKKEKASESLYKHVCQNLSLKLINAKHRINELRLVNNT